MRLREAGAAWRFLLALVLLACTAWVAAAADPPARPRPFVNAWRNLNPTEATLRAIAFAPGGLVGMAVGFEGTILRTADGGASWQAPPGGSGTTRDLAGVHMADARTGVAVGDAGTLLRTTDGGASWQPPPGGSGTTRHLGGVHMADARTGVAVGEAGTLLRTTDGGASWQVPPGGSGTTRTLWGVHMADAHTGVSVGHEGTILLAGPPNYAPSLDRHETTTTADGRIALAAWIRDEEGDRIDAVGLQVKAGEQDWGRPLPLARPAAPDRPWTVTVDPARYNMAFGSAIALQLRVETEGAPPSLLDLPEHVWLPWYARAWTDWRAAILAAAGGLALLALYLGYFLARLAVAPLALAGLGGAGALGEAPLPGGTPGYLLGLLRSALESLAIPWFVRHPRVRRAWIEAWRKDQAGLDDLGKLARPDFVAAPDFLDAWVETQLPAARAALAQLELLRSRRIYVALPVRLDDAETGRVIEKPEPALLRDAFARPRAVLGIIGVGGTGKSTLGCAIARWAMSDDPAERLAPHRMLPVFILAETDNLLRAVEGALRAMLPGCDLPEDLLAALLRQKRLLVVVDALSERTEATQRHVETLYGQPCPINALLVTSRRPPAFPPMDRTLLFPEPLTGKRLVPFIIDYLDRRQQDAVVSDEQALGLAQRLLALVKADERLTTATPLLALLFVEGAVARMRAGGRLDDLPQAIPEVFRDYVRRLEPENGGPVPMDRLEQAAGVLALASLGANRVPSDFERAAGLAALGSRGFGEEAAPALDRLVGNGLIEQRDVAGVRLLRFALDPAAEYLAALDRVRVLARSPEAWAEELALLAAIEGYPVACEGYLQALGVCYRAYRIPLRLPAIALPWET